MVINDMGWSLFEARAAWQWHAALFVLFGIAISVVSVGFQTAADPGYTRETRIVFGVSGLIAVCCIGIMVWLVFTSALQGVGVTCGYSGSDLSCHHGR